jgi:hypothetical protein
LPADERECSSCLIAIARLRRCGTRAALLLIVHCSSRPQRSGSSSRADDRRMRGPEPRRRSGSSCRTTESLPCVGCINGEKTDSTTTRMTKSRLLRLKAAPPTTTRLIGFLRPAERGAERTARLGDPRRGGNRGSAHVTSLLAERRFVADSRCRSRRRRLAVDWRWAACARIASHKRQPLRSKSLRVLGYARRGEVDARPAAVDVFRSPIGPRPTVADIGAGAAPPSRGERRHGRVTRS